MTVTIPPPPDDEFRRSPFTPTFGSTPPALVGRQQEVNDFAYALDNGPGSKGRATFVTGQRGVGKSVMLNVYHDIAASRGWVSIHASASKGFARQLTEARLPEVLEQLDTASLSKSKTVGANVSVLGFGGGFTNRTESTNTLVPDFRHQLMKTLDVLSKTGAGLLITLDEVHRSQLEEMQEITDAISYAFAQEAPVAFVAAGLPETINGLVNADVSTYLRRAERVTLENLLPEDTRVALSVPIEEAGGRISASALDLAVEGTGNYPYLVQLVGDEAWRAAADGDIRDSHVHVALDTAERSMFRQIHAPMIDSLPPREREYLDAMTADEGRSSTGDIGRPDGDRCQACRCLSRSFAEPGSDRSGWPRLCDVRGPVHRFLSEAEIQHVRTPRMLAISWTVRRGVRVRSLSRQATRATWSRQAHVSVSSECRGVVVLRPPTTVHISSDKAGSEMAPLSKGMSTVAKTKVSDERPRPGWALQRADVVGTPPTVVRSQAGATVFFLRPASCEARDS